MLSNEYTPDKTYEARVDFISDMKCLTRTFGQDQTCAIGKSLLPKQN